MWAIIAIFAVLYIGSRLKGIYVEMRSKNPEYIKEQEQLKRKKMIEKRELYMFLKNHVGENIHIKSDELTLSGISSVNGLLNDVEDHWIELYDSRKKKTYYIAVGEINDVSIVK